MLVKHTCTRDDDVSKFGKHERGAATVTGYDVALKAVPEEKLVQTIPAGPDGMSVTELVQALEELGMPRRHILAVLQAQFDNGRIGLGRKMHLVRRDEPKLKQAG
jgi:ABC-type arginine transport system ATPase subunit